MNKIELCNDLYDLSPLGFDFFDFNDPDSIPPPIRVCMRRRAGVLTYLSKVSTAARHHADRENIDLISLTVISNIIQKYMEEVEGGKEEDPVRYPQIFKQLQNIRMKMMFKWRPQHHEVSTDMRPHMLDFEPECKVCLERKPRTTFLACGDCGKASIICEDCVLARNKATSTAHTRKPCIICKKETHNFAKVHLKFCIEDMVKKNKSKFMRGYNDETDCPAFGIISKNIIEYNYQYEDQHRMERIKIKDLENDPVYRALRDHLGFDEGQLQGKIHRDCDEPYIRWEKDGKAVELIRTTGELILL